MVHRRNADGSAGAVFGKFTYDALGRRASAVYDDSGDGNLDNETVEYFAYDPAWRLSCIYRQGPEDEFGVRPAPVAYERFLYADGGLAGSDASFTPGIALDCPTHSQIDADADGTFERTRRFILNHFGDVAGVIEDHAPGAWSYELAEVVRYSPTGLPRVIGHFGADIDESGGSPDDADVAAFFAFYAAGDDRADFNGSGGTPDESDVALFFQVWDAGIGQGTPDDNRFGWRGYLWDARLGLYHVRHRVYDPRHAAWLTPDPAGYLDGLNLYAYCRGDLFNRYDPYGLDAIDNIIHAATGAADVLSFGLAPVVRDMMGNTYIDYTSPYYKGGAVAGAIAGAAVTGGASSGASSAVTGGALGGYLAGGVTGVSGTGVDAEIVVASMIAGAIGGYSFEVLVQYGIRPIWSGFASGALTDMSYQSILLSIGRQHEYSIANTIISSILGGSLNKLFSYLSTHSTPYNTAFKQRGLGNRTLTPEDAAEFIAFGERAQRAGLVESPYRSGSWGTIENGRYSEFIRIDVGEVGMPGWRGRTHMHIKGCNDHFPPNTPIPGA